MNTAYNKFVKNKSKCKNKEPPVGFEPTTFRLLSGCSANWAIAASSTGTTIKLLFKPSAVAKSFEDMILDVIDSFLSYYELSPKSDNQLMDFIRKKVQWYLAKYFEPPTIYVL